MAEYAYQKHTPKIWNGSSWDKYTPYIWNGSAWVEYPAMIYSEKTNQYLFTSGNQHTDITGGWYSLREESYGNTQFDVNDTFDAKHNNNVRRWYRIVTTNTLYCQKSHQADYGAEVYVRTKNLINLSDYKLLTVKASGVHCWLYAELIDSNENILASASIGSNADTEHSGTINVDVSGISGSCYIRFKCTAPEWGGHSNAYFTVSEVDLT